jgi:hypothetical protein
MILFDRLIKNIKTEIKNDVKDEVMSYVELRISNIFENIEDILRLEKMTDEEVIKFFKHSKFSEISKIKQDFLSQRYNFFISRSNFVSIESIDRKFIKVYPESYIADEIEGFLEIQKNRTVGVENE